MLQGCVEGTTRVCWFEKWSRKGQEASFEFSWCPKEKKGIQIQKEAK
ncbi:hypothetical protein NC652_031978 [Populus alba x Populus x berolinensis]|nr:hypothetical protein NC652_031978 [Populus alba x Populus x berolinensis]